MRRGSTTPQERDTIALHVPIVGDDDRALGRCLGEKQMVEGVAMLRRTARPAP
jgi:hypothetical protein